jgi:hypothetical protein
MSPARSISRSRFSQGMAMTHHLQVSLVFANQEGDYSPQLTNIEHADVKYNSQTVGWQG